MKLLLISPFITAHMKNIPARPPMYEPLGLAYLAAYAREQGHDPIILDCVAEGWQNKTRIGDLVRVGLSDQAIADRIREIGPDVVGITCMFTGFEGDAKRVAALAKESAPQAPVIVGGADATFQAATHIHDPNIDLIIRGEGEVVLAQVLDHYAKTGTLPVDLPGTVIGETLNPLADLIDDLDSLPFPARDLIPMATYLEDQTQLMPYAKRTPIGFLISSRGCPYDCVFCSTKKVWRKWRARSAQTVVDEIDRLVNDYGVREIAFQDDSFLANPKRVEAICALIQQRNIDITWTVPPGLTVWTATPEVLRAMRDSGFYRACFPIETGDPDLLPYLRKRIDLDRVRETIATCRKLGLWTYGNFIIGFPEQTAESIEKTAQYMETCGLDMVSLYFAQPYAGSDLYEDFQRLGLLDIAHAQASTVFHTRYRTTRFTVEELHALRNDMYKRFMKRRLARLTTPGGVMDMLRKMSTPENAAYTVRVFKRFAASSLSMGRWSLVSGV